MEREKAIALILEYGYIYSEKELKTYTDKQLSQILDSLFIELRIKINCAKTKTVA